MNVPDKNKEGTKIMATIAFNGNPYAGNSHIWNVFRMPLILFLSVSTLIGCSQQEDPFDARYNPQREKIGLPRIENGWSSPFWQKKRNERTWLVEYIHGKPCHASKKYSWNTKGLVWEQDVYYSGKKMKARPDDPDRIWVNESLTATYYFQDYMAQKAGEWKFGYTSTNNCLLGKDVAMDKLKSWGLKHPIMKKD